MTGAQKRTLHPTPTGGAPDVTVPEGTRMDLVCGPRVAATARDMARRWGEDRTLSEAAVTRLTALVHAAVGHGLRFGPRAVTVTVRWIDPDRMRVAVRWNASWALALSSLDDGVLDQTVAILDAFSQEWGFCAGRHGPVHWMVLEAC
jgi:hypothetical protein